MVLRDLYSLKKGDFITVEWDLNTYHPGLFKKNKMIICFLGGLDRNSEGYHKGDALFMLDLANNFRVFQPFGVYTKHNRIRKPTPGELFELMDAVRVNGYRYNRKTKKLTKIKATICN